MEACSTGFQRNDWLSNADLCESGPRRVNKYPTSVGREALAGAVIERVRRVK